MKSVAKIVLSVCFGALIFFPAETVAPEEKEDPSIRAAELMAIIEELKEHNEKLLAPPKEPEVNNYGFNSSYDCSAYRPLVEQYPWDSNVALAIMEGESRCNPEAHNATDNHRVCIGSYGLMQVGCLHVDDVNGLYDPERNIAVAYQLYIERGWQPWSVYTSGDYLNYLK